MLALIIQTCLLAMSPSTLEQSSEQIIKDLLRVEEGMQVSKLKGGLSGAELFLASFQDQAYVIRFSNQDSLETREQEILACTLASENDYGPKIYLADAHRGIIVMEYITHDPPEKEKYRALAELAKKIHLGPPLTHSKSTFDQVEEELDEYLSTQKAKDEFIPKEWLEKLRRASQEIRAAIEHYPQIAPCHRDLHEKNLLFSKGRFLAIDYEMAAQDDPFVDLATLTISYRLNREEEKRFLSIYLSHEPSIREQSKLYLMKQLIFIFWGMGLVKLVPDGSPELFRPLSTHTVKRAHYKTANGLLANASIFLRKALSNFDSREYQEALSILMSADF